MADVQYVTVTLSDGTGVQVVAGTQLHAWYLALAARTSTVSAASPDIDLSTLRPMAWFMTPHGPQSVIEPATITEFRRRDYAEITAQQAADYFAGAAEIPDVSFITGQELPAAMAAAAADDDSPFAVALRTALGTVSVVAPMPTGNAATDTANAQAAIDDTPEGGAVLFRASATHYALNDDLVFAKHISILGESSSANFTARSSGGLLEEPNNPPHLRGTVFEQHTAGKNIFTMDPASSGVALHMANIGGLWAPDIRDSDTGHGLEAVSAAPHLSHTDAGLMGFSLRNVQFFGHDGDHYGVKLSNPILGRLEKVYSYGGGGIHLHSDGEAAAYGNCVLDDMYALVRNAGTAHGYNVSHSPGVGPITYLTFIRPQCNLVEDAAASGVQYMFRTREAGSAVGYLTLIAPDMEGWAAPADRIDFGGLSGAEVVGTPILSSTPVGGVNLGLARSNYARFDESGSWTVPDHVNFVQARVLSAGGGGGAGGDNLASGGGGGGAGVQLSVVVQVTPGETHEVHVGAGGAGGAAGTAGANGGDSWFRTASAAGGCGGGGGGGATWAVGGGLLGGVGRTTVVGIPGAGGVGQFTGGGEFAVIASPGVVGGAGGGGGEGTAGGAGGGASRRGAGGFPESNATWGGARGDQPTANGSPGQSATTPGSGGGGGGGAGTGGVGGAGGDGAHGLVEIWW